MFKVRLPLSLLFCAIDWSRSAIGRLRKRKRSIAQNRSNAHNNNITRGTSYIERCAWAAQAVFVWTHGATTQQRKCHCTEWHMRAFEHWRTDVRMVALAWVAASASLILRLFPSHPVHLTRPAAENRMSVCPGYIRLYTDRDEHRQKSISSLSECTFKFKGLSVQNQRHYSYH